MSELRLLRSCLIVMGAAWVVMAGVTPKANAETFMVTTVEDGHVDESCFVQALVLRPRVTTDLPFRESALIDHPGWPIKLFRLTT
ncbi:MAG: hypothetical protein QMC73_12335 [Myxococcota bacterium]